MQTPENQANLRSRNEFAFAQKPKIASLKFSPSVFKQPFPVFHALFFEKIVKKTSPKLCKQNTLSLNAYSSFFYNRNDPLILVFSYHVYDSYPPWIQPRLRRNDAVNFVFPRQGNEFFSAPFGGAPYWLNPSDSLDVGTTSSEVVNNREMFKVSMDVRSRT